MTVTSETKPKHCVRCGQALSGAELSGNCPRCLATLLLWPESAEAVDSASSPVLRRLGDYELLTEVARGGMGVVFRARQVSLNRIVAVKVLRDAWLATPIQVKRFRAEAANAARLKHPNIVAVHEVGEQEGQHYFAMDLIQGKNLAEVTREGPVLPHQAAELVRKVAEAVQHAHGQGVLHRDIKPSNVLLDSQGEPHVTDFGLARPLDDESSLTLTGQVLGTPGYIAPEQAKGGGAVGPAADVYGLGALLFHLLTGRAPFVGASAAETLTQVLQQEPLSPRLLNPSVPVDLAAVCLMCLRKAQGERYGSAAALTQDIARFLANETTRARPAGVFERCASWARRKPALATLFTVLPLSLVLGLTTTIWEWRQAKKQASEAVRQRQNAEREELATGQSLYAADMNLVQQALAQQNLGQARVLLGLHAPLGGKRDLCGWEWWYFAKQCRGDDVFTLRPAGSKVTYLVTSRHLNGVVAGREDGTVELWDLGAQRPASPLLKETAAIHWLASDSEGQFLTTLTVEGPVKLWDITEKTKIKLLRTFPTNFVYSLSARDHLVALTAVAPELWVVPEGDFGLTGVWNWDSGQQVRILPESGATGIFSPNGDLLATGSYKGSVKIWRVADWSLQHELKPSGRVINLAFSPDGQTLVTCNWDGNVLAWDVSRGRYLGAFQGHSGRVFSTQFSPDGRILATASADQTIGLWDVESYRQLVGLKGHEREVQGLAFSPDGKWLASGNSGDGTMRIWKAGPESHMNETLRGYSPPVFAPDNRTVALANENGQVDLWDLERKQVKATLPSDPSPVGFTSDSRCLITATVGRPLPFYPDTITGLKFWNVDSQTLDHVVQFSPSNQIVSAAGLSPDGTVLATGSPDGKVVLWDVNTGVERGELRAGATRIWNTVFAADGKTLAIGLQNEVKLLNLETKAQIPIAGGGTSIAFSLDGKTVATGFFNEVKLWRTATGEEIETIRGHREQVLWLAFSKDGRSLASAGEEIKLWNLATGREVASFLPNSSSVFVGFSPDGRHLVGGNVGKAHIWTAAREEELYQPSAGRISQLRSLIRGRDPETPPNLIDLSTQYNAALTESWHPGSGNNDLATLPQGIQSFAGIKWDVRGLIQVGSETRSGEKYPPRISSIAVGAACRRLHFLHAAITAFDEAGTQIGSYVIHYENGQTRELPIVLGNDVADWFNQPNEKKKKFTVAWTGTNEVSREEGRTIRLFKTTWANPAPGQKIESIDFNWAGRMSSPFLVAITVE